MLADYVTVTKPMAHTKLGIIQAVFWVYHQLFHLVLAMSKKIFNCKNNPNNCCYFCGKFSLEKNQENDAYRPNFDLLLGYQDKPWAPHKLWNHCSFMHFKFLRRMWISPLVFTWSDRVQVTIQSIVTFVLLILAVWSQNNCQTIAYPQSWSHAFFLCVIPWNYNTYMKNI